MPRGLFQTFSNYCYLKIKPNPPKSCRVQNHPQKSDLRNNFSGGPKKFKLLATQAHWERNPLGSAPQKAQLGQKTFIGKNRRLKKATTDEIETSFDQSRQLASHSGAVYRLPMKVFCRRILAVTWVETAYSRSFALSLPPERQRATRRDAWAEPRRSLPARRGGLLTCWQVRTGVGEERAFRLIHPPRPRRVDPTGCWLATPSSEKTVRDEAAFVYRHAGQFQAPPLHAPRSACPIPRAPLE